MTGIRQQQYRSGTRKLRFHRPSWRPRSGLRVAAPKLLDFRANTPGTRVCRHRHTASVTQL